MRKTLIVDWYTSCLLQAIFVDEKCVFPPIDNPAQPRCGKRNTDGLVNNLDVRYKIKTVAELI